MSVDQNPNSGEFILNQLRRFGSNINLMHEITFWLYFPNEEAAHQAARRAESAGLKPELSPPLAEFRKSKWLFLLYCPHIPDEQILDGISQFCADLAAEFNGEFDGWEARLELEPGEKPKGV